MRPQLSMQRQLGSSTRPLRNGLCSVNESVHRLPICVVSPIPARAPGRCDIYVPRSFTKRDQRPSGTASPISVEKRHAISETLSVSALLVEALTVCGPLMLVPAHAESPPRNARITRMNRHLRKNLEPSFTITAQLPGNPFQPNATADTT
jgi:hypothetical protein